MKCYRRFLAVGLCVMAAFAMSAAPASADILFTENFEGPTANYTATFGVGATPAEYFNLSNAAGVTVNAGITGNATVYLGTQNIDGAPLSYTTAAPALVTFNPINITNYNTLNLSFSAAGLPAAEVENYIGIYADLNGDATYETPIFNFLGAGNTAYTDNGPSALGALGAGFANFSNVAIPQPSISTLNLQLRTFNDTNSANEATAFDNLVVNGTFGVPPVVNPIQVPVGGITQNFNTAPPVQQWSQLSSAGAAGDITTVAAMDARMATLANTNISGPLGTVTGAQAASGNPNYNSTNGNLQTGVTGNAAGILMASLQNATGSDVTSVAVTYDLGLTNVGGVEEIFGHTVYYSTTGATNSWTQVGTFGTVGGAAVQPQSFNLNLGSWANGANLYLAFTDDNGSGSPDQWFTIDNVTFTPTLSGGGITEPIAVTSTPASGTVRAAGQTVQVANAAAGAGNTRDGATLSGLAVTTSSSGTFSQTGLSNGVIAAGSSQTGTVAFNGAGLLNGYQASGTLAFSIASGPNGAGTGAGAYSYPLTATVTGNVGDGTAPVAAAGSYAGLSSTSGLVSAGGSTHLNSTATILAGTNSNGGATTVSMTWSLRALNEQRPGFTNPPLPNFASALTSDRVDLTGTDGDIFVLQMSYDPAELLNSEATDAADGQLFLASFNTASGAWVNAVSMNHGVNVGATNVQGGWATAGGSTLALGAWGVDIVNNVVWAVLDHNSLFASVPEPSTIVMGLMGLVGLVGFARRRKA